MADPVAEAGTPLGHPMRDNGEPLWAQIVSLFARRGLETPPTKLRDELVIHLAWARWAVDHAEPKIAHLTSALAAERERNARLVRENGRNVHALEFVARMAWRTDPPNANAVFTESERLGAIKHHPVISQFGQPHRELAEREAQESKP